MIPRRIFGSGITMLDLDGISEKTMSDLETFEHRRKNRRSGELLIGLMIRQSLKDGAIAMSLFSDSIDHCLRSLQYVPIGRPGEFASRELFPAPPALIEPAFNFVRSLARIQEYPGRGVLMYKLNRKVADAEVEMPSKSEVRIYFGTSRPEIKNRVL